MNQKIYWRLLRNVTDGDVGWSVGYIVGEPADGLIEIGEGPESFQGAVLSRSEIEYKREITA